MKVSEKFSSRNPLQVIKLNQKGNLNRGAKKRNFYNISLKYIFI